MTEQYSVAYSSINLHHTAAMALCDAHAASPRSIILCREYSIYRPSTTTRLPCRHRDAQQASMICSLSMANSLHRRQSPFASHRIYLLPPHALLRNPGPPPTSADLQVTFFLHGDSQHTSTPLKLEALSGSEEWTSTAHYWHTWHQRWSTSTTMPTDSKTITITIIRHRPRQAIHMLPLTLTCSEL